MHREIQRDQPFTFTWRFYGNGIQLVPSAAKISILTNSGTVVVNSASGTIASDGTITYAFLAAANANDDLNFRVEVKYTISSVDHYHFELFDVVLTPLVNNVRDEDLFQYVPELRANIFETLVETIAGGSTTTFKASALQADRRDFTGGRVEIYISDTIVHDALITVYVQSTGTVTFSPAYATAIGAGLKVRLRGSFQGFIDEAFNEHVMQDVRGKIGCAAKFIDVNAVRKMTIDKALEIICLGRVETADDKWDLRYKGFGKLYGEQYGKISNDAQDANLDGNISEREDAEKSDFFAREIQR